MMNHEDKARRKAQAVTTEPQRRRPGEPSEDAALQVGEIQLSQPLRVTDEDAGGDPYNHTGRFTVDKR